MESLPSPHKSCSHDIAEKMLKMIDQLHNPILHLSFKWIFIYVHLHQRFPNTQVRQTNPVKIDSVRKNICFRRTGCPVSFRCLEC
jgi:hypothetical protein